MRSSIPHFRFGRDGRLDPFAVRVKEPPEKLIFILLTGRGQVSYLFPDVPLEALWEEAETAIPLGYTQIWVIEWAGAAAPGAAAKRSHRGLARLRTEDRPMERVSWVLIGENGLCLGWAEDERSAMDAAAALSEEKRLRIAVGLLRQDVTWH